MKMQNTSHTDQQTAQRVLRMAEGLGGIAIQRMVFTSYPMPEPAKRKSYFGTNAIATMVASLTEG